MASKPSKSRARRAPQAERGSPTDQASLFQDPKAHPGEEVREFLRGLTADFGWVQVRGLNDIQNGLIRKLQEQNGAWNSVLPSFWGKMRHDFGAAVLTEALTQLVGVKEPQNPVALVMAKCQMIAGGASNA